ncbi:ribonuclease H2 subunit A [Culicoides brevitarsis]|uniref:ribonuclease H2 subunit A n=1 Tax=Culicoides brevitarsis TaxID=469753 RepID=UPI00307C5EBA
MNVEKMDYVKIESLDGLGEWIKNQDNAKSFVNFTIPEICKTEPCILGVDEAGRGPVLGPMVYGIAFCPKKKDEALKTLGCADSKQLTEEKREEIFVDLNNEEYAKSCVGWAVEVISPNVISTSMNRRVKYSLNEVSMGSAIDLIKKAVELGVNVKEVYVDTVGPPEKYQAKLKGIFPDFKITVAKKADSTYPIVSAASICAKVSRDHALKVWSFREGIELEEGFGSGYPGDPATKRFLDNVEPVFGFPRLVRFSWSTATKALEHKAYSVEFDEEEEEEKPKKVKSKQITQFFGDATKQRHLFFKERCLENIAKI